MAKTNTAREHNLAVAWIRLWGALGAQIAADSAPEGSTLAEVARSNARFEARRFATACYALSTTPEE